MKCNVSIAIAFLLLVNSAMAKSKDDLHQCWTRQVQPLRGNYLKFSYEETLSELEHSFKPWQATYFKGRGDAYSSDVCFLKNDTIRSGPRTYFSKTQFDTGALLFIDYGDKELFAVTPAMHRQQYYKAARYSPAVLINYFYTHQVKPVKERDKTYTMYSAMLDKTIVTLYISRKTQLLDKVITINHEDLYGDVVNTYYYTNFTDISGVAYPKTIVINKIGDKLKDTVQLQAVTLANSAPALLAKPDGYAMKDDTAIVRPSVKVHRYSDHVHFVDLEHTNGKSMIVEFRDFLLVAEAPLTSGNGELIINEARKIAPGKPVKYFAFGHYHPDYIGGIRAFVHKDATVVCAKTDLPYVGFLTGTQHTLEPDSLQMQPHTLRTQPFDDSLTITDGSYQMKLYFMGAKSAHTNDYIVYYFPAEKLLFEDDLASIPADGSKRKSWKGQTGLYNAIRDLGLDVHTIVQSWPIANRGVKSEFQFAELEAAMKAD